MGKANVDCLKTPITQKMRKKSLMDYDISEPQMWGKVGTNE